jgi:hypothetical protein
MSLKRRKLLVSALPIGTGLPFESGLKALAAGGEQAEFDQDNSEFWTSCLRSQKCLGERPRSAAQRRHGVLELEFFHPTEPSFCTEVMGMIGGKSFRPNDSSARANLSPPLSHCAPATPGSGVLGLGIAAIAQITLGAFNGLFSSSMFSRGSARNQWIIRSVDTPILARQRHPGHAAILRSGAYLVFARQHREELLSGNYEFTAWPGTPNQYQRERT